jgi:hypothetical protein
MAKLDGFWTAHFFTPKGQGAGVAYITDSEIYGGDSGYTYRGTYETVSGGRVSATLNVTQIEGSSVPSVFGIFPSFKLILTDNGQGNDSVVKFIGTTSSAPGVAFQVELRKSK